MDSKNMRSFKQYLQEEIEPIYELFCNFYLESSLDEDPSVIKRLKDYAKTTFPNSEFIERADVVEMFLQIQPQQLDSILGISGEFKLKMSAEFKNEGYPVQHISAILFSYGLPKHELNYEDVNVQLLAINDSLSGLDKFIGPRVQMITIQDGANLRKNVLSLFKMPHVKTFSIERGVFVRTDTPFDGWSTIVMKHLKGDRNIAACQTELLKNGFKNYAKI